MSAPHAVALCTDEQYLPYTAFVAAQIAQLPIRRSFDIFICSSEPLVLPEALAGLGIRTLRIEQGAQLAALKTTHLPMTAYLRLWLPQALGDRYQRILYLDGDVFLEAADLNRLLAVDLGGNVVGAIRDMQQWLTPQKHVRDFISAGLPCAPYFNSGVLVLDAPGFNRQGILDQCLAFCSSTPQAIHHHDQSVLNCVMHGRWTELSPLWNWQWAGKRPLWSLAEDIQIAHFAGNERKPWNDPHGLCPPRYRAHWERFIGLHFPGFQGKGAVASSRLKRRAAWLAQTATHCIIQGRVRDYLDRFDTLDVSYPLRGA